MADPFVSFELTQCYENGAWHRFHGRRRDGVVGRGGPGRRAADRGDLVDRVARAGLAQVRRPAGLGQVRRPVAGRVQRPVHLPHRRAGEPGPGRVERAPLHLRQPVQRIVDVELVQRTADRVRLPQAVEVLVVAVLVAVDVGRRAGGVVLPPLGEGCTDANATFADLSCDLGNPGGKYTVPVHPSRQSSDVGFEDACTRRLTARDGAPRTGAAPGA